MKGFESPRFPGRKANATDMYLLFGQKKRWPIAGLPSREIQGIVSWVEPLDNTELGRLVRGKSRPHRVQCLCPHCGAQVSAGRLAKHLCGSGRLSAERLRRQRFAQFKGHADVPASTAEVVVVQVPNESRVSQAIADGADKVVVVASTAIDETVHYRSAD